MKKMLVFFLLVFCHAVAFAQFKTIAEGPVFEEPQEGFARILQMKNGNTIFLLITKKDGLDIKIYDANHKQKVVKNLDPKYGKLKRGFIEAIFEVNGDAVLMIGELESRLPVLYRLVVDGTTGAIKEEDTVVELPAYSHKDVTIMAYGHVSAPSMYVRKDPFSDNYAVATMNTYKSDRNKQIEVIMYGGDHKEVARAYYKSPEDKYKNMVYIDMAIVDAKTVNILAYAYNTRSSGGKENVLVLASLDKGAATVDLKELDFAHNLEIDRGVVKYNPVTRKMIMLAYVAEPDKKKAKEFTTLAFIDPFKKTVDKVSTVFPDKASEKSLELFGKKAKYEGKPQNLFINQDGSFSVVYEELTVETRAQSNPGMPGNSGRMGTPTTMGRSTYHVELGNMAVSTFDKEGKPVNSYFIPKNHYLFDMFPNTFYHAQREGSAAELTFRDQFKSFAYVNVKDKIYVLFNDVEENEERAQKGKLTTIRKVDDCNGFYYTLNGNSGLPPRQFLFGKPDKYEHNLALFSISDYDKEKNIYVTLLVNVEGRKKGAQVVWMEP